LPLVTVIGIVAVCPADAVLATLSVIGLVTTPEGGVVNMSLSSIIVPIVNIGPVAPQLKAPNDGSRVFKLNC
jgi:hypothetical protein